MGTIIFVIILIGVGCALDDSYNRKRGRKDLANLSEGYWKVLSKFILQLFSRL